MFHERRKYSITTTQMGQNRPKRLIGNTNSSVVYPSEYVIKNLTFRGWSAGRVFFMREERFRQAIRLRLLAFVLALALTWYAMNPAPGPIYRGTRDEGQPDENRREVKPTFGANCRLAVTEAGVGGSHVNSQACAEGPGELEWPEFIDTGES